MPNQVDLTGIQINTYAEILDALVNGTATIPGFKQIYGDDINVASNSPDGQQINIYALTQQDLLDLMVSVYNSKDPDQAIGTALDAVSQLCGIIRNGGTYTEIPITVTTDRVLNLYGLDSLTETPFTISDTNGTQFYLKTGTALAIGANVLTFRAKDIGAVTVGLNTLTTIVTSTLGVLTVNNPSAATTTGIDQETDALLRIRRQKSVGIPAQGAYAGLYGGLYSVDGMEQVIIYENATGSGPDAHGVSANSIWVIVDGGSDADVAEMIYKYRNLGCGMDGGEAVDVTQVDGSTFEIRFDRAEDEDLYVKFGLSSLSGGTVDEDAAKAALVAASDYGIYEAADISAISAALKAYNSDLIITDCQVSNDNANWDDSVLPTALNYKFVLTTANITIL
jgi:uncharacterized phage protein gp47/JayE